MSYSAVIRSPFGRIGIREDGQQLHEIDFLDRSVRCKRPSTALGQEIVRQLQAYLDDPTWQFDLPVAQQGTPFRQRVWQRLRTIPSGDIRTYGELARELASSPRAVGGACRHNPIPLVVPCHRVIAANGVGGFGGDWGGGRVAIKQWLLEHEQA